MSTNESKVVIKDFWFLIGPLLAIEVLLLMIEVSLIDIKNTLLSLIEVMSK